MRINGLGVGLIKEFEELRLVAYRDGVGKLTIGWGHTRDVQAGQVITEAEAEELLDEDLAWAEETVERVVPGPLTENQFSALVSFVFNVGPGKKGAKDGFVVLKSGKPSTLLRLLREAKYSQAADEILKWNKAKGKPVAGLTRRRKAERELFLRA